MYDIIHRIAEANETLEYVGDFARARVIHRLPRIEYGYQTDQDDEETFPYEEKFGRGSQDPREGRSYKYAVVLGIISVLNGDFI